MKYLLEKLLATPRRSTWLFVVVVSTLAVTPIIVAVVALLSGDAWFPAGDMAQAELHMRGFFNHPPLVGPLDES